MEFSLKKSVVIFPALFMAIWAMGCGSGSTNNDQGTSFTAVSYCAPLLGGASSSSSAAGGATFCRGSRPISQAIVGISDDGTLALLEGDGNVTFAGLDFRNNLSRQFLQLRRIDCSLTIPGADASVAQPIRDSRVIGAVLPPNTAVGTIGGGAGGAPGGAAPGGGAGGAPGAGAGGTIAGGGTTGGSVSLPSPGINGFNQSGVTVTFDLVSPDLFSLLNVSRNNLPQLPFRGYVECTGVGSTQAGDALTSNPLGITLIFVDRREIIEGGGNASSATTTATDESMVVTDGSDVVVGDEF